ncbi:MAG: methyl-accepting chemotaxis protein [Scytonema sp. PMC 1070.18]|nr:methyl-accepting chemotaxis protein [Scytonema sp. PMC 1070.18]
MVKILDSDNNRKTKNTGLNKNLVLSIEKDIIYPSKPHHLQSGINNVIAWFKRKSLRTKAIAFAFAIGTVPVLVVGTFTYYLVDRSTTKDITYNKQDKAQLLANNITRFMQRRYEDIQLLSKLPFLQNQKLRDVTSRQQIEYQLNEYLERENSYESIAVFDLNGNLVAASQGKAIPNPKNEEYFQAVLKTNSAYISQSLDNKNLEGKIYLAAPVKDSDTGKTIYIIRTVIPAKFLQNVIITPQNSQDDYQLIDATGKIFMSTEESNIGKNAKEEIFEWEQLQTKQQISTSIVWNKKNNTEELITYVPWQTVRNLPNLKWELVLSTNTAVAFATQRQLLLVLQIGTAIAGLVVGGIAAILANRLMQPIIAATMTVKRLGMGNLDTRIMVKGRDELATLASNINQMADQLQTLLKERTTESEQLKSLTNILLSIRSSLNAEDLFQMTVTEARAALKADRVVIYHLNIHGGGKVIAESVASGFPVALEDTIKDTCIDREIIEAYKQGRILAVNNVLEAGFAPDHLNLMHRLQIKANLVVPIIQDERVFGFLIAHHCQEPHVWQSYEITFLRQLALQVGLTLERVNLLEITQALKDLAIHLSKTHITHDIYNLAIQSIRKYLKTDRVVIYKINENLQGSIIAESVVAGYPVALGAEIHDPCLKDYVEKYRQGRVIAINDIYKAGLSECYIKQLEPFAVKANLVAPVLLGDKLLGLLIAHQCTQARLWQQSEIDLFEQFARLLGLSLERANLFEQAELGRKAAEEVSQQQRDQKEQLQLQLLKLIDDVEAASKGDLTVRAEITAGEIGTVADFFNSILENLREIVTQVKLAATQVNSAIADNSGEMSQLAVESLKQAQEISRTLDAVDQMTLSIQAVSKSATQAAEVARTASKAAETGGAAMDLTVENIMGLRETIGETGKKVKRLGEASQQISHVVALINQIAMQTNLLAINAGIEAARAGEDAQGFAVIAEEVAVLAAQSSAATSQIAEIVANIQRETGQVVRAMEMGTTQVVEGTQLVQNTKQSLNHILNVCRQIDELVHSISGATVSQVQTSHEVSVLMQEIAKVSEMTSNSSSQVSVSLDKTVAISQQLQESVRRFKVN